MEQDEQETQVEAEESEGMKNLRESRDREKARADALEAKVRNMVFSEVGVNPESWIGQQMAKEFDGDLTADSIRQFAADKGIPLNLAGDVPPQQVQQELNQNIAAQAGGQRNVEQVMQGTVPRDTQLDPLVEANNALAEGDIAKSILLKTQAAYER